MPNSSKHLKILRERKIAKLPKETKQRVLDLTHEGKSIGEICEILELDTLIVGEIIVQNIEEVYFLRREAKP